MKKILLIILLGINYLYAQNVEESFYPVLDTETQLWYFVDKNGEKTVDIQEKNISDVHPLFSNRALAKDVTKDKWGYLDASGKWAIAPIYDGGEDFVDNYTVVFKNCADKCNPSDAGLLTDMIGIAIDTKGKVYFTDNSQDPEPFSRRMLYKHVGKGVFVYNSGIGIADLKYYCDLKGNVISDRFNSYDVADFHLNYCPELNAYLCKNTYINSKGEVVLDLTKYAYATPFVNGYCWAEYYNEETDEYYKALLDTKLNEVLKSETESYSSASLIENGKFTYEDSEGNLKLYDIAKKQLTDAPEKQEWQKVLEENDAVYYPNEGVILLVEYIDYRSSFIGFINKEKKVFLFEE